MISLSSGWQQLAAATPEANGPVSIVITYRARPENRADFRQWLETEGGRQFAQWKKAGVVADCQILFSTFAATVSIDAVVILDFPSYTESARWKEVEKKFPGGLNREALRLAAPEATFYAEPLLRGGKKGGDQAKSCYMLAIYDVAASSEKYRNYATGYIEPQMRSWVAAGALSSYRLMFNQAPLGVSWDAILFMEYRDIEALAHRDELKASARVKLAETDPVWLAWSKDKSDIRREKAVLIAEAIPLPE